MYINEVTLTNLQDNIQLFWMHQFEDVDGIEILLDGMQLIVNMHRNN